MDTAQVTSSTAFVGDMVLREVRIEQLATDYEAMLRRLYPRHNIKIRRDDLKHKLHVPTEILTFVVDCNGRVVSTSQGTLVQVEPDWNVLVGNVITQEGFDGNGHGRKSLETLMQAARVRWGGGNHRDLTFALTNKPSKGNAGFYESLGFGKIDTQVWAMSSS